MPFFRHNGKLIYFAHVPKCGGTSIEHGLKNAGITLSFWDAKWRALGADRWSNSSPQHISCRDIARVIDMGMFDFAFTCVRDPVERLVSAYSYNRQVRLIPFYVSLSRFLSKLERRPDFFGYKFDNHFVPASDLVPDACKVFRLESGLDRITDWLREVTGDVYINISFEHRLQRMRTSSDLDRRLRKRIEKLYNRDYERFFGTC